MVNDAPYDEKTLQANFSALLYLMTEQQALIGKLMNALLENGVLGVSQLHDITDTHADDGLVPTYTELYKRFASYYLRTKQLLDADVHLDPEFGKEDEIITKEKDDG